VEFNRTRVTMCARFYRLKDMKELYRRFGIQPVLEELGLQYNIAPTEQALVIPAADGPRAAKLMTFGLPNPWRPGAILLNMRDESFASKPGFRNPLMNQRCLVVADGFFEWRKTAAGSLPYRFWLQSGEPFGLAGICNSDQFAIITTQANSLVAGVHDRMPVIIRKSEEETWLDSRVKDFNKLIIMLAPYPAAEMETAALSKKVNSATYKEADLLAPLPDSQGR